MFIAYKSYINIVLPEPSCIQKLKLLASAVAEKSRAGVEKYLGCSLAKTAENFALNVVSDTLPYFPNPSCIPNFLLLSNITWINSVTKKFWGALLLQSQQLLLSLLLLLFIIYYFLLLLMFLFCYYYLFVCFLLLLPLMANKVVCITRILSCFLCSSTIWSCYVRPNRRAKSYPFGARYRC